MGKIGEMMKERRAALGLSQEAVAQYLHYSKAAVGKIERGETAAPGRSERLARFLEISEEEMVRLIDEDAVSSGKLTKRTLSTDTTFDYAIRGRRSATSFAPELVPGSTLVGDKNLPVYAAAMGGEGHQIITFDPIDYVKRPAILESVKNAYGIYIVGESMIPAYRPGDLGLVHPHLPLARDVDVVLFHVPPVDEAEAMIKHLLSYTDAQYHLEQFNPHQKFDASRADWPYCHQVVGKYNRR